MEVYGNLMNRLDENRNTVGTRFVGEDITMYYYSDRTCYYISKVVNDKDIFVLPYHVCADREKATGQGHQDWLYFKTAKEENEYLSKYFPEYKDRVVKESTPMEWCFVNNKWKAARRFSPEVIRDILDNENLSVDSLYTRYGFTKRDVNNYLKGKEVVKYSNLSGKVSFGVKNYFYDWCF